MLHTVAGPSTDKEALPAILNAVPTAKEFVHDYALLNNSYFSFSVLIVPLVEKLVDEIIDGRVLGVPCSGVTIVFGGIAEIIPVNANERAEGWRQSHKSWILT
jgi:hypothetical protein